MSRVAALLLNVFTLTEPAARATPTETASQPSAALAPEARRPAFEVNVLWPFFPGGISELKTLLPVLRADEDTGRGELLLGLHSDFATRIVRPDEKYGKVATLALKLGYRQFIVRGLHAEATVNLGWRHEKNNVHDGTTLDALAARAWLMAGYQLDLSRSVYANLRGGVGLHLFRTDHLAEKERLLTGGADINLGFRF